MDVLVSNCQEEVVEMNKLIRNIRVDAPQPLIKDMARYIRRLEQAARIYVYVMAESMHMRPETHGLVTMHRCDISKRSSESWSEKDEHRAVTRFNQGSQSGDVKKTRTLIVFRAQDDFFKEKRAKQHISTT